jgi:UDP-glucose 4-epimerase
VDLCDEVNFSWRQSPGFKSAHSDMKNILVTGGAGYIGSATAALFLQAGHKVTVFDNLFRGHREAVPEIRDAVVRGHLDVARIRAVEL